MSLTGLLIGLLIPGHEIDIHVQKNALPHLAIAVAVSKPLVLNLTSMETPMYLRINLLHKPRHVLAEVLHGLNSSSVTINCSRLPA